MKTAIVSCASRRSTGLAECVCSVRELVAASASSDVDLLVDVKGPTTPWFPGGLVADLEDLLNIRVDVVEPDGLRGGVRERVLEEARAL